ncbi:MAG TPA: AbrB family transcriptional regulator [Candidatus Bathyarchaeia archaeon]|nr:AbrB family transcriptional regulator [Candidatus Bathyarchaeia archaeon]
MMGEITSVATNKKGFASLRTTIPMPMLKQWQLKPKDKLKWRWEVIQGKMVAVVERYEEEQRKPKNPRGTKK